MNQYINFKNLNKALRGFYSKKPFPYAVIDNFFNKKIAKKLEREFPDYKDKNLHEYKNYCEVKKTSNNWNLFPPLTYKIFSTLNSQQITKYFSKKLKIKEVFPDYGLHGGGWHLMRNKGKLNPHLDYYIHPKADLQRKFNLIIFLTKGWKKDWGGETCFYKTNKKNKKIPGKISKKIYPKFNRAIFFDVSQNSWHSVMGPKKKITRNSMAVYYLINPIRKNFSERKKAFYAPTEKQKNNKKILKFISLRSNPKHFSKVYKTK
tara:strand:- start:1097 stop:1882 length:786 start_codon:yes stop_codon:yes gene_type:complete